MGEKGDKNTSAGQAAAENLLGKLSALQEITSKKMFGGHGIFHGGRMFGMVNSKGQIFFKSKGAAVEDYEKYGARKHSRMPYYEVPQPVLNDPEKLSAWAQKSITISK